LTIVAGGIRFDDRCHFCAGQAARFVGGDLVEKGIGGDEGRSQPGGQRGLILREGHAYQSRQRPADIVEISFMDLAAHQLLQHRCGFDAHGLPAGRGEGQQVAGAQRVDLHATDRRQIGQPLFVCAVGIAAHRIDVGQQRSQLGELLSRHPAVRRVEDRLDLIGGGLPCRLRQDIACVRQGVRRQQVLAGDFAGSNDKGFGASR
jgi:hypothetical protein